MDQLTKDFPPRRIGILPVRNTVLFPGMTLPLSVGREKSLKLLKESAASHSLIGVIAQIDANVDLPGEEDLFQVGTVGRIIKSDDPTHGSANILIQGLFRFKLKSILQDDPFIEAEVVYFSEPSAEDGHSLENKALGNILKDQIRRFIRLSPNIPDESTILVDKAPGIGYLADLVGHYLDLSIMEKQQIQEAFDLNSRLKKASEFLSRELDVLELENRIKSEARERMGSHEKEAFLREQMKVIQKELGDGESESEDLRSILSSIEEAHMPEEAHGAAMKEAKRLHRMHPSSPEYQVLRSYLDWMLDLPWSVTTEDNLDLAQAQAILDEDHYGLEKVKRRIVEFLAVRKLKNDHKGPILCFQGPPGVGKTSLGKSIARALGRKFVRISLGGVHDEAEIRGHRRTYIGALPGRIIKGLKKAGSNNPVFMLDEIEKMGRDYRGDPASALLEVLDPEQNHAFSDHYIDVTFDLSKVMFIATANLLDNVPAALLDRMEVINIPGYSEDEKIHIANRFLIPENTSDHGIQPDQIEISPDSLSYIINRYTRESGVRNLKRELASVFRWVAKEVAMGHSDTHLIEVAQVREIMGREKYEPETAQTSLKAGVATGLAWTATGGDILFVEATMMKGKGGLTLTGQLGEVMKESAQAALSYIRSHSKDLRIEDQVFSDYDFHLHVPAGATPKDGPSAGITMAAALTSLLRSLPVRSDVAMTGEITLRGDILPIGGVKEKVLAAKRAGIMTVLIPERNQRDLDEISESSKKNMKFVFVKNVQDVLDYSLNLPTS